MKRSVPHIVLHRVLGFVFFLILLAIANVLVPFVHNQIYGNIIVFFDANLLLLFMMMLIGMVNDIFWSFFFPFNILAPLTSAFLSILIVTFFYRIWIFLNLYIRSNAYIPIAPFYVIVPLIVFIAGYVTILVRLGKPGYAWEEEHLGLRRERWERRKERMQRRAARRKVDWEDVGDEFRLALYNLGERINRAFESDKQESKAKQKRTRH